MPNTFNYENYYQVALTQFDVRTGTTAASRQQVEKVLELMGAQRVKDWMASEVFEEIQVRDVTLKLMNAIAHAGYEQGILLDNTFIQQTILPNSDATKVKDFMSGLGYVFDPTYRFVNPASYVESIQEVLADGSEVVQKVYKRLAMKCPYCSKNYHSRNDTYDNFVRLCYRLQNESGHEYMCKRCVDTTYFTCGRCNTVEKVDESEDFDGQNYCSDCASRLLEDTIYFKNDFVETEVENNERHIGCEVECYINPTKRMKFDPKYVLAIKHDGSLSSESLGYATELVTQPIAINKAAALDAIFNELKQHKAEVDKTCGGHIHVDSQNLNLGTERRKEIVRNLFRIYEGAFYAVTAKGRSESTYCAPVTLNYGTTDSRYHSLNFVSYQKYGTLEFRCFGGSLEAQKWMDRIALSEGFVNFAYSMFIKHAGSLRRLEAEIPTLAADSGFDTYANLVAQYNVSNGRTNGLHSVIKKNGECLINLAGARFGLQKDTIHRLIKLHKQLWDKT